jgi:serine/tyrosine/threonine adenylyltransferase
MHHLGIPTTRAMSLVATGTTVLREEPERGAIVVRMAPSWIRFGTFELPYYTKQFELVKKLADYVVEQHFPEFAAAHENEKYIRFYSQVVSRTAKMVAHWQAVGFAHGVLNTYD